MKIIICLFEEIDDLMRYLSKSPEFAKKTNPNMFRQVSETFILKKRKKSPKALQMYFCYIFIQLCFTLKL